MEQLRAIRNAVKDISSSGGSGTAANPSPPGTQPRQRATLMNRLGTDPWLRPLMLAAAVLLFASAVHAYEPTSRYAIRNIEGWQVYVHKDLLPGGKQAEVGAGAIRQLRYGLAKIRQMVATRALEKLLAVKIWLEVDSTNGKHGRTAAYQYHPDLDWLQEMDFNPAKQKCVEYGDAASLARHSDRDSARVTLHELAHAYHDQVLSFQNPDVLAAQKRAREEGKYPPNDWVLRADHKEFFAGLSVRYFGTENDRRALVERDPIFAKKLKEFWSQPRSFLDKPLGDVDANDRTNPRRGDPQGRKLPPQPREGFLAGAGDVEQIPEDSNL